ncbi:PREDICTED: uncharacterized protein KIAA1841 homolog [Papilio xuthus]|uniref:Uncharacterized protein KIAA1841 homolog n=1 Tax=Papilio xuthus TaxID=66420 RepID=A0AAJ6Z9A2_PAPXU|nr:PREDICTED: uncharacterized protein KIAA1841 homolog [Papilio xuthus]
MASPNPDNDAASIFVHKSDNKERNFKSPERGDTSTRINSSVKPSKPAEIITVKDFFDFMKTAYQVYEHLEGNEDEAKINWEALTKLTVINHVIEPQERELLRNTAHTEQKPITSKSDTALEKKTSEIVLLEKRFSYNDIESKKRSIHGEIKVEMLGAWTEANLNCKLNDVINEGILDSILPYLVGYKKPSKTTSVYTPIIKKSNNESDVKKPASFGGFVHEKESKDRLGRRKSSIIAIQEKLNQKHEGDVEIHVCDEVKGLKKDFKCPQKLLVSKMGYFADVTAGQRLEDMDISVHCDIQIFDWLMRWVKRDTILVADWPLLDPHNVIPILVSASFLQMEPLLHDCLIYCHAHMNDIVKTSTNLACLSDALLTRLAAMYTNAELEAVRDRRDKIQSRLYCKLILSLAEPVPETLRGHYATLATLFKCTKCNKLLGRHVAEQVPCQPSSMRIDRRGNVVSAHAKDLSWSLNEYITWLYGELRSWRRVYWRLWADCHFLRCQLCDTYFPVYQMEWCSHHEQSAALVAGDAAAGRYPCCGQRAYRFETLPRNTGCQFREHVPEERNAGEAAVVALYARFRDLIAMRPPHLVYPERLTRFVAREPNEENSGRLQCREVFWWEGIQLVPPRQPLGLLGKLYTSNTKFNPSIRPGSPSVSKTQSPPQSIGGTSRASTISSCLSDQRELKAKLISESGPKIKQGASGCGDVSGSAGGATGVRGASVRGSSAGSEQSASSDSDSANSDEDRPPRRPQRPPPVTPARSKKGRVVGRQWLPSVSARSNQDGQRRYEERAATQMRTALARRHAQLVRPKPTPGGVYARLEAEWREKYAPRPRVAISARPRPAVAKYK